MKSLILSLIAASTILVGSPQAFIEEVSANEITTSEVNCDTYARKVYCGTNEARLSAGKTKLSYSLELEQVSKKKSDDMCARSYFSHDYQGRSWEYFLKDSGLPYSASGENLAKGFNTPDSAVKALINSPSHYDNMISDYTHIGVYTTECGGTNYTTQTFAKL